MAYKNKDDPRKKEAKKRYYEKNKQQVIAVAKINNEKKREYIRQLKESTPCCDCGIKYPWYVMDFDHARGVKIFELKSCHVKGWQAMYDEIAKCDIVCSNCHRERSYNQGVYNTYPSLISSVD